MTTQTTPTTPAPAPSASQPLRLGQAVMVKTPDGVRLINNETGGLFDPGVPTPQTVTPTLLRRLQDGDLLLAA